MSNKFANLARANGTREPNDCYATPGEVTRGLLREVLFEGPVLEPAAGPHKLIAIEFRRWGHKVTTADIQSGRDFLKRSVPWNGDIVTNPPYLGSANLAFASHALNLCQAGKVALLLRTNAWHGEHVRLPFFTAHPPRWVLAVPWRIKFILPSGEPIPSQAYDHSWFVWDTTFPTLPGETRLGYIQRDGE